MVLVPVMRIEFAGERADKREAHAGPILWHISQVSSNANPPFVERLEARLFQRLALVVAQLVKVPALALST